MIGRIIPVNRIPYYIRLNRLNVARSKAIIYMVTYLYFSVIMVCGSEVARGCGIYIGKILYKSFVSRSFGRCIEISGNNRIIARHILNGFYKQIRAF